MRSALRTNLTVPSGWWQAPRPSTRPAQRLRSSSTAASRPQVSDLRQGGRDPGQPVAGTGRTARPTPARGSARPAPSRPGRTGRPAARRARRRRPSAPSGRSAALLSGSRGRLRGRYPGAVIAADQHGLGPGEADQAGERRAERRLGHVRRAVGLAQRAQHRAWLVRRSRQAEPARTVAGDQRQMSQRLDVLNQGRPPVDTALGHPRRGEPRQRRPSAHQARQRGFLPGQEARRRRDDPDRVRSSPWCGSLRDNGAQPLEQPGGRSRRTARRCRPARPRRPVAGRRAPGAGPPQQSLVLVAGRARPPPRCRPRQAGGRPEHGLQLARRQETRRHRGRSDQPPAHRG